MPNHLYLIWELLENNGKESPASSLMKYTAHEFKTILRVKSPRTLEEYIVDWKSRKYNFWHPKPDWFRLYKQETIEQKLDYIHFNPMRGKWSLVTDPVDYCYSSARFYEKGIKKYEKLVHVNDVLQQF